MNPFQFDPVPPLVPDLTLSDQSMARLTRMAARLLGTPLAMVSLVDSHRQRFVGCTGLPELQPSSGEAPLSHSFCRYVVDAGEALVVEDAREHPVLRHNPAVNELGVVAYAGAPLRTRDGRVLGAFAVIDHQPRHWSEADLQLVNDLAESAVSEVVWGAYATQRDEADAALQRSEALHRSVVESAGDAILVVDSGGTIRSWNRAAQVIFGYDDMVGRPLADLIPTGYRKAHRSGVARFLSGVPSRMVGRVVEVEAQRSGGELFPVELCVTPWTTGGEVFFTGIIRDITERRRAERDYRGLFEGAHDAIVLFDLNERVLDANPQACELYGFDREEFVGMSMEAVSADAEQGRRRIGDTVAMGGRNSFELEQRRRDGTAIFVEVRASMVEYDGAPAILSINRDITESRRAERALKESEAEFRAIFDGSAIGIALVDLEGRVVRSNPALERKLGYTAGELRGMTTDQLTYPDDVEAKRAQFDALAAGERERFQVEKRFVRSDGSLMWGRVSASLARGADGEPRYAVEMVENITEHRAAEEALEESRRQFLQAQKMEAVGRLAGGVAHDFNNLLTVILGNAELLLMDLALEGPGAPGVEEIDEIRSVAKRAAELTQQLLAFSRKQVLHPRVLDLNQVLASTDKLLRRLLGADVEIVTSAASELGRVTADPGQMEQVLVNLAVNARDAMAGGGRLTLATADREVPEGDPRLPAGRYVTLTVSDTGHGMDEATLSRVFEPFFTTKEVGKGTGLGLSTVYGIVRQSGGTVTVASEPGRGTTFVIYLPHTDSEVTGEEPGTGAFPRGGTETVLLVEDDEQVRTVARRILTRAGYPIVEAAGLDEALALAGDPGLTIDLLVCDVVMPGANGPRVAAEVARLRPGLGVLYVSGYTDDALEHHGPLDRASILAKPFTPQKLLERVRQALDESLTAAP